MVNYYLEESIMLYPVRVKVGRSNYEYAMLTLEQANQKFVVIDGCLVEQDVIPLRACDVQERLGYEISELEDAKASFSLCPPSYSFMFDKLQGESEQAERNITALNLAKQHCIAIELAKEA